MMSELEILENIGTNAVLELRRQQLAAGEFFMINSKDLPAKQTYLEYPDGHIDIVIIAANQRSFDTMRRLTDKEAEMLRQRFNLV